MTTNYQSGRDAFPSPNRRPVTPQPMTVAWPPVRGGDLSPGGLDALTRALASVLAASAAPPEQTPGPADDSQLLDVRQAAKLLQVSRSTVIRLADEGRLPAIVVRTGKVQKTRRIPRAFVERMIADAASGASVDMDAYVAAWLAEHAQSQQPPGAADGAA